MLCAELASQGRDGSKINQFKKEIKGGREAESAGAGGRMQCRPSQALVLWHMGAAAMCKHQWGAGSIPHAVPRVLLGMGLAGRMAQLCPTAGLGHQRIYSAWRWPNPLWPKCVQGK